MSDLQKVTIAFLSIFFGGMIYVLWRESILLMFSWFDIIGASKYIYIARDMLKDYSSIMPDWFYFSLPNGLWLLGGLILFSVIWGNMPIQRLTWILIFTIIAFGSELGQRNGFIPGTFDVYDIFIMIICSAIAIIISNIKPPQWRFFK